MKDCGFYTVCTYNTKLALLYFLGVIIFYLYQSELKPHKKAPSLTAMGLFNSIDKTLTAAHFQEQGTST